MLNDAHVEHTERSHSARDQAEAEQRAAAEAEEVRRLREQLRQEHPELAAYAQQQTS
ncbi:hypothetical protein ACWDA9_35165 [Streptomyces sp. NPDC001193]